MLTLTLPLIAKYVIWIPHTLYIAVLLPQIHLNSKLRSTHGLSDLKLFGYFLGYVGQMFYVFCIDLPLVYKVLEPLGLAALSIILLQRFYYHDTTRHCFMFQAMVATLLITGLGIVFLPSHTRLIGLIGGWTAAVSWGLYGVPQVMKIYRAKSTHGFSFAFATILGIAIGIELFSGFTLELPLPTLLNNIRGVLIYLVYCVQFLIYNNKAL